MNKKTDNTDYIWNTLSRIQRTLELDDKVFCELLLLTEQQLLRYRSSRKDLFFSQLANLSETLDISVDKLNSGGLDYSALIKQYRGEEDFLPERYTQGAFSRIRTSILMLEYVHGLFGWQERLGLLKHFQVSESIFSKPDQMISILFPSDICAYLNRYKLDAAGMFEMGLHTAKVCIPTAVQQKLASVTAVSEIYELMCQEFISTYYDQNCDYRLMSLNAEECVVDVIPRKEVCEKLKRKTVGNRAVSSLRRGIAASYPVYVGLPQADVKHVSSIFDGDGADRYVINYGKAVDVFKQKRNRRLLPHPSGLN